MYPFLGFIFLFTVVLGVAPLMVFVVSLIEGNINGIILGGIGSIILLVVYLWVFIKKEDLE